MRTIGFGFILLIAVCVLGITWSFVYGQSVNAECTAQGKHLVRTYDSYICTKLEG